MIWLRHRLDRGVHAEGAAVSVDVQIKPDPVLDRIEDELEALRWFVAYKEAKSYLEDLRVKDLAELLLSGVPRLPNTKLGLLRREFDGRGHEDDGSWIAEEIESFFRWED